MTDQIPLTRLAKRYATLPKNHKGRLAMAKQLLRSPDRLVQEFYDSMDESATFFDQSPHDHSTEPFYDEERSFRDDIVPGLSSTPSLGRWFEDNRGRTWKVLGDVDRRLDFHYLDRELVSTRAPGECLAGGRSTRFGPRLDLLLAKADSNTPVIGEVKVTSRNKRTGAWQLDKDPFYALIQALASAAYVLPQRQFPRLIRHDPQRLLDVNKRRVVIYLMIGREPDMAREWFELRDCAEGLSHAIVSNLSPHVEMIAGVDLDWFDHRPAPTRLRITKRFAHTPDYMSKIERDPERGRATAAKLKAYGAKRILIKAAEQGYITQLACKMPECFCPEELGGACHFEPVTPELSDWMPTVEHYPLSKREGGKETVGNVVLAHRLCNRIDYSMRVGRSYARDLERIRNAREEATRRNNEGPDALTRTYVA